MKKCKYEIESRSKTPRKMGQFVYSKQPRTSTWFHEHLKFLQTWKNAAGDTRTDGLPNNQ